MSEGFQGNKNVKAGGTKTSYTREQIVEYAKCADDPCYFIENYVKVISLDAGVVPFKLRPYQRRIIEAVHHNRFTLAMLFRQSGKSTILAAYMLWYATFNDHKTSVLLANKQAQAIEIFSRVQYMYELLPDWLKQGALAWNKKSVQFENGSRILASATSSSAVRGMSCVTSASAVSLSINDDIYRMTIGEYLDMNIAPKRENEKYYIYKTTNNVNGKYYIGFHKTSNPNDGYMGSGSLLKRAIEKYGIEHFSKEILYAFDTQEEAEAKERELVNREFVDRDDNYNVSIGGNVCVLYGKDNGFSGKKHSEETKKIIGERSKGNKFALRHLISCNGTVFHGYKEVTERLGISRHNIIRYCGDPTKPEYFFVDPYIQDCAEYAFKNKEERLYYDIKKAKEFANKWNREHGFPEYCAQEKINPQKQPYVPQVSATKGKRQVWNLSTLRYKYIDKDAPLPDGYSEEKPAEAKLRDKGKRHTTFSKGKSKIVWDENGKRHLMLKSEPTPEGWFERKPAFLPKTPNGSFRSRLVYDEQGNRHFLRVNVPLPDGWKYPELSNSQIIRNARRDGIELPPKEKPVRIYHAVLVTNKISGYSMCRVVYKIAVTKTEFFNHVGMKFDRERYGDGSFEQQVFFSSPNKNEVFKRRDQYLKEHPEIKVYPLHGPYTAIDPNNPTKNVYLWEPVLPEGCEWTLPTQLALGLITKEQFSEKKNEYNIKRRADGVCGKAPNGEYRYMNPNVESTEGWTFTEYGWKRIQELTSKS